MSDTASDCLFCRVIAGELPATVVAESDSAVAVRDIAPGAPTHVLVLPRRHVRDATEVGAEDGPLLGAMVELANEVARLEGIGERGYRLVFNIGEDAGNSVGHLHLHVVGGRRLGWPPG